MTDSPSNSMREYLAEIYRLQEDNESVSTTHLADRLNVSAPAVPRMLKRLKSAGYVRHIPYQGVALTDLGQKEALAEIRRHRLLEVFLMEIMGFGWDEAHEHADQMGIGVNNLLAERMAEMTGNPARCPHGEPIPTADGEMPTVEDICLLNIGVGYQGMISRVRTHDGERMRYFSSLGIAPGKKVELLARAPFNGPIRLRVDGRELVLGVELAKVVWVSSRS